MFGCPRCKATLPADAVFCNRCGNKQLILLAQGSPLPQGVPPMPPMRGNLPPAPPNAPMPNNVPPALPNAPRPGPMPPGMGPQSYPQGPGVMPPGAVQPGNMPQQVVRSPTPPQNMPMHPMPGPGGPFPPGGPGVANKPYAGGPPGTPAAPAWAPVWNQQAFNAYTGSAVPNHDRFNSTLRDAARWRQSWRDRQRSEAGPAVGVARGQSAVAEPLMALQNSIARMRAIVIPKNQSGQNAASSQGVVYKVGSILLACLIAAIGIWQFSALFPASATSGAIVAPVLKLQGQATGTYTKGQQIALVGSQFSKYATVTFSLNGASTLDNVGTTTADDQGSFTTSIAVGSWLAGNYILLAQDNVAKQDTSINIQVVANLNAAYSNNTALPLTNAACDPVQALTFVEKAGLPEQKPQSITLTNSGTANVNWSVAAVANNSLNWLVFSPKQSATSGTLAPKKETTISVYVNPMGLPSRTQPYIGQIIITVQQGQPAQIIVPVTMVIQTAASEVIISPNPIMVTQKGTACQNASLTIINLGSTNLEVAITPKDTHMQFDSQTAMLAPAGQSGDTKVLNLTCSGVQANQTYNVAVSYGKMVVTVQVRVLPEN